MQNVKAVNNNMDLDGWKTYGLCCSLFKNVAAAMSHYPVLLVPFLKSPNNIAQGHRLVLWLYISSLSKFICMTTNSIVCYLCWPRYPPPANAEPALHNNKVHKTCYNFPAEDRLTRCNLFLRHPCFWAWSSK